MIAQNTKNIIVLLIKMCEVPKGSDNVTHIFVDFMQSLLFYKY